MKLILLMAAFVMMSSPVQAQEKVCTQMGCTNGLVLRSDEGLFDQPGKYDFQFFLPGKTVTCKGSLPLEPCDKGHSFTCSSKGVMITESGCALPKDQHKIGDIYVYGTPKKLVMIANRNKKPVLVRTLHPTYVFTRPNGPGCEPQCVTGSLPLSLKDRKD